MKSLKTIYPHFKETCGFLLEWESASEDESSEDSDGSWIDLHHSSDEDDGQQVSCNVNLH